ncbi:unnamed protein product [Aphanomyces euteiches]
MEEARVEGLLALLKNGQSISIRNTAAEQLGQVVTSKTLAMYVEQIRPLLQDHNWDVRVAAAQSVGHVCEAPFIPSDLVSACAALAPNNELSLSLSRVDIKHVLEHASPLLKSGGEEYNYNLNLTSTGDKQKHLLRQRYLLWKRISHDMQSSVPRPVLQQSTTETFLVESDVTPSLNSARTRKTDSLTTYFAQSASSQSADFHPVAMLITDCLEAMFDAFWERRHGAVAVLRDVFVKQSALNVASPLVQAWLDEAFVRCVCVLAMEQYVDYSADGSVAPIRLLVAQIVGHWLPFFPQAYSSVILPLLKSSAWHACHAGLLSINFCPKQCDGLIWPTVVDMIFRSEDEIQVVVAQLVAKTSTELSTELLDRLWSLLSPEASIDLAPAYILDALRRHMAPKMQNYLSQVAAFLKHALIPVREAAILWLKDILTQFHFTSPSVSTWWLNTILSRLVLDKVCQTSLQALWNHSIAHIPRNLLNEAITSSLSMWIRAIWSLETKLVFKNLSNNDDIIAFPHTADISQAFFASTCLAGLLDSTVDHSVWTTWVINSLKSSRYLEIMVVKQKLGNRQK